MDQSRNILQWHIFFGTILPLFSFKISSYMLNIKSKLVCLRQNGKLQIKQHPIIIFYFLQKDYINKKVNINN